MKIIDQFKTGDEIVRLEPAKPYHTGTRDRSYLGEKLTFIGIANGNIYLERDDKSAMTKILDNKEMILHYDIWSEGWNYWQDPKELFSKEIVNIRYLKACLDKALIEENYEEAEKIRKQIDEI